MSLLCAGQWDTQGRAVGEGNALGKREREREREGLRGSRRWASCCAGQWEKKGGAGVVELPAARAVRERRGRGGGGGGGAVTEVRLSVAGELLGC